MSKENLKGGMHCQRQEKTPEKSRGGGGKGTKKKNIF